MSSIGGTSYSRWIGNCTRSEAKVEKVTHVWTIHNFNFCEAKQRSIRSPKFSSPKNDDVSWLMILYPNGKKPRKDDNPNTVDVGLRLSKSSKCETVFAYPSISVLDEEIQKEFSSKDTFVRKFCIGDSFWRTSIVKNCENFRKMLWSNNFVLKIYCEILYSQNSDVVFKHHRYCDSFPLESAIVDNDFGENMNLILENLQSNVVISVKGKTYPTHKGILAAKSKVFAAMFQHDMKESKLNRIEIEDIDEEIVSEMLRYIYFGKCEKLDQLASGLLAAADKYDLNQLKIICIKAMCKNLSIENAAEYLILADQHDVKELKTEVIRFIVAEPTKVLNSAGWKSVLSYPLLIDEVFRAVAGR